ncbi:MAG TPA: universal stress protein, partial [Candidatus Berkiella sp.]|nr:universal stress protein [Candidatus Berkiella sp.]
MLKKMIYATDLGPQSFYIAEQAVALAKLCQAVLLVHHVVEPPPTEKADFSQRESAIVQKQNVAQKSLRNLCTHLQIDETHQMLTIGEGQSEILRVAKERQCDL